MAKSIPSWLILLLLLALALRLALTMRTVQVAPGYTLDQIPVRLGTQPAVDLPLTPFEVDLLAPDGGKILQRRYGQGSNIVWLAAVQSRHDWRVQHPPQVCYVAQGWRIEEQGGFTLPAGGNRVQRMVVQKGTNRRLVYYLYTDGKHWTSSYFWRIFHALLDRAVRARVSTWTMIQLSTPLEAAESEARLSAAGTELFKQP